jgi:hypothetical protein
VGVVLGGKSFPRNPWLVQRVGCKISALPCQEYMGDLQLKWCGVRQSTPFSTSTKNVSTYRSTFLPPHAQLLCICI